MQQRSLLPRACGFWSAPSSPVTASAAVLPGADVICLDGLAKILTRPLAVLHRLLECQRPLRHQFISLYLQHPPTTPLWPSALSAWCGAPAQPPHLAGRRYHKASAEMPAPPSIAMDTSDGTGPPRWMVTFTSCTPGRRSCRRARSPGAPGRLRSSAGPRRAAS